MSEERTERMMEGRKQGWEREVGETEIMRERWGAKKRLGRDIQRGKDRMFTDWILNVLQRSIC